jgi:hypothetical protein
MLENHTIKHFPLEKCSFGISAQVSMIPSTLKAGLQAAANISEVVLIATITSSL